MIDLKQNVQYVKSVGPAKVPLLNHLNIYTLEDLLKCSDEKKEKRGAFQKRLYLVKVK